MTAQENTNYELYESMSDTHRNAIDLAFSRLAETFRDAGLKAAPDDRAEILIGHIALYLATSNE